MIKFPPPSPSPAAVTIRIIEDSCGRYWARVVQEDPVTAMILRSLHQRFKTHTEAMDWAKTVTQQWQAS